MKKITHTRITTANSLFLTGIAVLTTSAANAQSNPAGPVNPIVPVVAEAGTPSISTSAGVKTIGSAEYRLAPDDVLNVNVVNFPNLSVASIVVPPDGRIGVPLLAPVTVAGLTVGEVTAELTKRWQMFVIQPSVFVTLAQKRRDSVVVYGYVLRPGALDYKAPMRTLDAVAQCGGSISQGDLTQVTITRRDGLKRTVDLSHPETRSGTDSDIVLGEGDAIYIPERRSQFTVIGQVTRPGSFDYRDDMTVLDALTAVGGVLDQADLNGATLIHAGVDKPIDLDGLLRHGEMAINVKLSPGDRILIPEARKRVYIFGAVDHPGYYNLRPGDRILDALHNAGGALTEADLKQANLVHIDETKNTGVAEKLNIERILSDGDMTGNVALHGGDVLFIPTRRKKMQWSDMWVVLSGLNLLNTGAKVATKGLGAQ